MITVSRQDILVIVMGIDTLLESVSRSELWWSAHGDSETCNRIHQLWAAILATRSKFVREDETRAQIARALFVADGLREAARHCNEGQAALHARLMGGAEAIEWLCRSRHSRR